MSARVAAKRSSATHYLLFSAARTGLPDIPRMSCMIPSQGMFEIVLSNKQGLTEASPCQKARQRSAPQPCAACSSLLPGAPPALPCPLSHPPQSQGPLCYPVLRAPRGSLPVQCPTLPGALAWVASPSSAAAPPAVLPLAASPARIQKFGLKEKPDMHPAETEFRASSGVCLASRSVLRCRRVGGPWFLVVQWQVVMVKYLPCCMQYVPRSARYLLSGWSCTAGCTTPHGKACMPHNTMRRARQHCEACTDNIPP